MVYIYNININDDARNVCYSFGIYIYIDSNSFLSFSLFT